MFTLTGPTDSKPTNPTNHSLTLLTLLIAWTLELPCTLCDGVIWECCHEQWTTVLLQCSRQHSETSSTSFTLHPLCLLLRCENIAFYTHICRFYKVKDYVLFHFHTFLVKNIGVSSHWPRFLFSKGLPAPLTGLW
jgi:hypothetical protein